ncbi:hypothetical protein RIF29_20785 [Crotalaria pallida]|uniref:Uncharacterized protein n=1 Tax=Crotalaria pallida TaxID=3830 RepID=A0AAN9FAB9_CROPI
MRLVLAVNDDGGLRREGRRSLAAVGRGAGWGRDGRSGGGGVGWRREGRSGLGRMLFLAETHLPTFQVATNDTILDTRHI